MKLLLVEDDVNECNIYKKIESKRTDVKIVAMTNSDIEALQLFKTHKPEGIILDLELNNGTGTGFNFLEELNKLKLKDRPKIVVTTNVCSDSVYEFLHRNKVDFIFYKKQNIYSQEKVINTILLFENYTNSRIDEINVKEVDENKNKISDMINEELDLIGISTHLKGRKYLYDAIYYLIDNEGNEEKVSAVQYLMKKYKNTNSAICRAMQNAIMHAWRVSPLEDLSTYYTARINYETGIPTPTEFMYYYANKIKRQL